MMLGRLRVLNFCPNLSLVMLVKVTLIKKTVTCIKKTRDVINFYLLVRMSSVNQNNNLFIKCQFENVIYLKEHE